MKIGGVSIILILAVINMVLILFQLSTGLRWIKAPFRMHRTTGMILFISGALHGIFAYLANYGTFCSKTNHFLKGRGRGYFCRLSSLRSS